MRNIINIGILSSASLALGLLLSISFSPAIACRPAPAKQEVWLLKMVEISSDQANSSLLEGEKKRWSEDGDLKVRSHERGTLLFNLKKPSPSPQPERGSKQ